MGGTPNYVWRDGQRLTPWMLYQVNRLDADCRRLFGVGVIVSSAIRLHEEQKAIFLARYTRTPNGRRVYDTRWWNGQLWYRISSAGTVAQPGTSNHEIQGNKAAVDLRDTGADGGLATGGSARSNWLRQNAGNYDMVPSGFGFREPWHYDIRNIFNTPPQGGFLMALSDQQQEQIYQNIAGNNIPFARLIAQQILDMGIEQAKSGRFKGKATTLRSMLAWNDENIEATRDLLRTIRADLHYIHQVSPYSLKAILEAAKAGDVTLTDEQAQAIAGQLSAVAVESLAAALEDDFESVKDRLAQLPAETIAALKSAL